LPGASAVLTAVVASGLGAPAKEAASPQAELASHASPQATLPPHASPPADSQAEQPPRTSPQATSAFYFGSFLPRKKAQVAQTLKQLSTLQAMLVFFESPYRIVSTLEIVAEVFVQREVAIARELTKLHEEVLRGSASELLELLQDRAKHNKPLKGELVIVIAAPGKDMEKREHVDRYAKP
jgi:16S rRNA (cytidine1402-2'-O)-methyltransferase